MTRSYQMLQLAVLLLVLTACPSAGPSLDSQFSSDSGTASLSWDASAGTDIAGYKIYLATASGAYGTPIATTSTDITTYTVPGWQQAPPISSLFPRSTWTELKVHSQTKSARLSLNQQTPRAQTFLATIP